MTGFAIAPKTSAVTTEVTTSAVRWGEGALSTTTRRMAVSGAPRAKAMAAASMPKHEEGDRDSWEGEG
jgi:hypothetical protein